MSVSMPRDARHHAAILLAISLLLGALLVTAPATRASHGGTEPVRFATFNASLNRNSAGQALADLSAPGKRPGRRALRRSSSAFGPRCCSSTSSTIDAVKATRSTDAFQDNYLSVSHDGTEPIEYPYVYVAESNTGHPIGLRPEQRRRVDRRRWRRQRRRSRLRLLPGPVRRWRSSASIRSCSTRSGPSRSSCGRTCPARCCPTDPATTTVPADWYSPAELEIFRLKLEEPLGRPDRSQWSR